MSTIQPYFYGFAIPRPAGVVGRLQWDASEAFMVADLAKSGLVAEDVRAYPLCLNLPAKSDAAYVLPYYGTGAEDRGRVLADGISGVSGRMFRTRVRYPRTLPRAELKKFGKYTQPARAQIGDAANMPYVLPSWWDSRGGIRFIVEGEKKAACVEKRWGVPTLGIAGCDNWKGVDDELHGGLVDALEWCGRDTLVIIIPDGDIRRMAINRAYRGLADRVGRMVDELEVVNFSEMVPDKLDDWLVANVGVGREVVDEWERYDVLSMVEDTTDTARTYDLMRSVNAQGTVSIIPNVHNVERLLGRHPSFKGVIRYNLDKQDVVGGEETVLELTSTMQRMFNMPKLGMDMVKSVAGVVAHRNEFSPRAEWLDGLRWDGRRRLVGWMEKVLGVARGAYTDEVGVKALVGAVARVFEPGCMVDFMVILRGAQGVGKSSAIKMLFGAGNVWEYSRGMVEGKDWLLAAHKAWCVSDEELGALTRADKNHLKAQITTRVDMFRAPYSAETREMARRFVWWGSTNDMEFLPDDASGLRRYAVVEVGQLDWVKMGKVREQLWAEAVVEYRRGEVDYSGVVGTSAAVSGYVMADSVGDDVEEAVGLWLKGAVGRGQVIIREGRQVYWLKMRQIMGIMGQGGQYRHSGLMREIANSLRKIGWQKIGQIHILGEKHNSVYTRDCAVLP